MFVYSHEISQGVRNETEWKETYLWRVFSVRIKYFVAEIVVWTEQRFLKFSVLLNSV